MLVAVIYTGEIRTMEKTIEYFKKNILLNDNVHIFSVLQSNDIDTNKYEKYINDVIGNNLKSLEWFDKNDYCWCNIRESLLKIMQISEGWKRYLRTSGSMIEYYQLFLAYKNIIQKEYTNNIKYDYIIRTRTDIIITKPIDFYWLKLTKEDIKKRLNQIIEITKKENINSKENIHILMNSLLSFNRIFSPLASGDLYINDSEINEILNLEKSDDIYEKIQNYIENGKYIITLRKNLVYVVKRDYFSFIPTLGVTYGLSRMINNNYWFNAESQLQTICLNSGLSIYDSTTILEDKSLYEYNEKIYFDDEKNIKADNGILFFIRRK